MTALTVDMPCFYYSLAKQNKDETVCNCDLHNIINERILTVNFVDVYN